ncbi:hypothetical protein CFOL_v3_22163, partial [Cephalotus follicularis]
KIKIKKNEKRQLLALSNFGFLNLQFAKQTSTLHFPLVTMDDHTDEWELCNDDGFVYKRKKRRLSDPHPPAPSAPSKDPQAEEINRRERKRKTLLKLKQEYAREIHQWELLSNNLRVMQDKRLLLQQQQQQQQQEVEGTTLLSSCPSRVEKETVNSLGSLVDELLLQADSQEAVIQDMLNLCDIAETMCSAQEEKLKQWYIDHPIWFSLQPQELLASLHDEKELSFKVGVDNGTCDL